MYPYNINTHGEIVELTNKESSIETHNDEDAMIIYDENDQDSDSDFLKSNSKNGSKQKHSNLFNSSFFSQISLKSNKNGKDVQNMVKGEQCMAEFENSERNDFENAMIILDSKQSDANNDSLFLDKELMIDNIPLENALNEESLSMIQNEVDQLDNFGSKNG